MPRPNNIPIGNAVEKGRPRFFASAVAFQKWLAVNHARKTELIVGIHKGGSGKGGLTYPEALDEALCVGWIDGVRRTLDATSYSIRFSPRKPRSIWSKVNLRHVERLQAAGRMQPTGLKIHEARSPARTGIYSFENRPRELEGDHEIQFKAQGDAWEFFQARAPSYRRTAVWWVISAKKPETRARRLAKLIAVSARGELLPEIA